MPRSTNVSPVSYKNWLRLIFDHPTPLRSEDGMPNLQGQWFWQNGVNYHLSNPTRFVEHTTRLCREFSIVAESYTLEQIDQGIWFLLGPQVELGKVLADASVPAEKRMECVRAMFFVYSGFVAVSQVEVMENCFDMWWDMLCTSFWSSHLWRLKGDEIWKQMQREDAESEAQLSPQQKERCAQMEQILSQLKPGEDADEALQKQGFSFGEFPSHDAPKLSTQIEIEFEDLDLSEQQVMDTMLETLSRILYLDDERCEIYALHGLNHLNHPQRAQTVQRFIDLHCDEVDEEGLVWLEGCRDGKLM